MSESETRILAADQRKVRDNLKMILEAVGYRVDTTGDSKRSCPLSRTALSAQC